MPAIKTTKTGDYLARCRTLGFGEVVLSPEEEEFRWHLDQAMVGLCRVLPEPSRTPAMLFLLPYSGLRIGDPPHFFNRYYHPSWTILHSLARHAGRVVPPDLPAALARGHAMAMFLHRLDDHLDDGEVPATHLVLLIRSEAWHAMRKAFGEGAAGDPKGSLLVERFIADYYDGMTGGSEPDSLDGYCALFRKQMATWLVAPILLARRVDDSFTEPVRSAYESFGIAWRLLDDVTDAREDAISGARSSVYLLLSREGQRLWRDLPVMNSRRERSAALVRIGKIMEKRRAAERLAERILAELENAAIITGGLGMGELASQYRAMAAPMAPRRGAP